MTAEKGADRVVEIKMVDERVLLWWSCCWGSWWWMSSQHWQSQDVGYFVGVYTVDLYQQDWRSSSYRWGPHLHCCMGSAADGYARGLALDWSMRREKVRNVNVIFGEVFLTASSCWRPDTGWWQASEKGAHSTPLSEKREGVSRKVRLRLMASVESYAAESCHQSAVHLICF